MLAPRSDIVELLIGQMLYPDERIASCTYADQLVQFGLNGSAGPVLRVLDQKHHQKGHDGGAGIDHELPGVGEAEQRAGDRPNENHGNGGDEGRSAARGPRRDVCDLAKQL